MRYLTFVFAGSGHGMTSDDDSLVDAYKQITGPKAFFPGPGGKDTNIYTSPDYQAIQNHLAAKSKTDDGYIVGRNRKGGMGSANKRSATGKGWNRNVWHALRILADYLSASESPLTLNIVGHSRGSITIIMMLNDIFYSNMPTKKISGFTVAGTKKGNKTFSGDEDDFDDWYRKRISNIYDSRMGGGSLLSPSTAGQEALDNIWRINFNLDTLSEINAFMFDPVGGVNQGNTARKQTFPEHNKINSVRVLRMEHGNAALSTHMPTFPGWTFVTGDKSKDLLTHKDGERLVIPMPGSHGAGLSNNGIATVDQRTIGTTYMTKFLKDFGTSLKSDGGLVYDKKQLYTSYRSLYTEFNSKAPGTANLNAGATRRAIHATNRKGRNGGYTGGYVNGHHKYLAEVIAGH